MSRPVFWCFRCQLMTSNVLEADQHEREHVEIRKIGTMPDTHPWL